MFLGHEPAGISARRSEKERRERAGKTSFNGHGSYNWLRVFPFLTNAVFEYRAQPTLSHLIGVNSIARRPPSFFLTHSQIVGFFSYIPLLGTLVRYVFELGLYYQGYYFYTSAS